MASPQRTKDARHGVEHLHHLRVRSFYGKHTRTHTHTIGPHNMTCFDESADTCSNISESNGLLSGAPRDAYSAITGCRSRVREHVEHEGREVVRDNRSEPQLARDLYVVFLEVA